MAHESPTDRRRFTSAAANRGRHERLIPAVDNLDRLRRSFATGARRTRLLTAAVLLVPGLARADTLRVEDAIRTAWRQNAGIAASAHAVDAARADAEAARDARLPSLTFSAKALATDEPMTAFGLKLDQQRITQSDFEPSRLNAPDPVGGVGLGVALMQPIYMGGRITAGRRATGYQAEAEQSSHQRRLQETAVAVVQAYFGTQAAAEGLRYADDVLRQARETERFVRLRNAQGLMLASDVARATAFRAQAEAGNHRGGCGMAPAGAL